VKKMTEKIFIKNIKKNDRVNEVFYVEDKSLKTDRNNKFYLDLVLKDKTGSVNSKVWNKAEEAGEVFSKGDFILIGGIADEFNEKLQINIDSNSIRKIDREQVDLSQFVEILDPEQSKHYMDKLIEIIEKIEDPHIKKLLNSFFSDPDFGKIFMRCPAARSIHHDFLGGLLKHTFYMLVIAKRIVPLYKGVSFDLVAAGIILHDIGKIEELKADISIEYTDEGKLLGHPVIGILMVRDKIKKIPGFPKKLAYLIEHILLSHHGQADFGALKPPLFREAMLVHLIDTIDSKMEIMNKSLGNTEKGEFWSEKCWAINDKNLLRVDRFLSDDQDSE